MLDVDGGLEKGERRVGEIKWKRCIGTTETNRDNREHTDRQHKLIGKENQRGKRERESDVWREVERKGGLIEKKRI